MKDNVIIETKDLCKYYLGGKLKALDGVDATIDKGEVVVVIGPSGSGKSTFLRSLNMLEIPTKGAIYYNGNQVNSKKTNINLHRQKMGMVFQHFNLFPHMTILRNMTIGPMKLLKKSKVEAEAKAMVMLAEAQAEANKLLAESLTGNLLEKMYYEKWDGKLPYIYGGDNTPIIQMP